MESSGAYADRHGFQFCDQHFQHRGDNGCVSEGTGMAYRPEPLPPDQSGFYGCLSDGEPATGDTYQTRRWLYCLAGFQSTGTHAGHAQGDNPRQGPGWPDMGRNVRAGRRRL